MSVEDVKQLTFLEIPANKRESILTEALEIVSRDRNLDYGEPERNFTAIAELWTTYLNHPIEAHDVAVALLLVKVARIRQSPSKADHWIDIAGYAACGGEVAHTE